MDRGPLVRLVVGVLLIAAIVGGDDLYGWATGPSKISSELDGAEDRVNVVVHLPFTPERYHLEELSQLGAFAGRAGGQRQVRLLRVTPGGLTAISRLPWVSSIEPDEIAP
jgi:hypothetical protein